MHFVVEFDPETGELCHLSRYPSSVDAEAVYGERKKALAGKGHGGQAPFLHVWDPEQLKAYCGETFELFADTLLEVRERDTARQRLRRARKAHTPLRPAPAD